jgi:ribosome maturation factor RimP
MSMPAVERTGLIQRISELADQAAAGTSIEIAEVQLRGAGKARLLRVYIDRPGGVTHADCELISQRLGKLLDDEDAIPGASAKGADARRQREKKLDRISGGAPDTATVLRDFLRNYTLEVSSPGVERSLSKPRDFERVVGQKIRLAVRDPIEGATRFEGKLARFADQALDLEISPGRLLHVPLEAVHKANLKFEW